MCLNRSRTSAAGAIPIGYKQILGRRTAAREQDRCTDRSAEGLTHDMNDGFGFGFHRVS